MPPEAHLFADVAEMLAGFLPDELRAFSCRHSRRNMKVWFGADGHEHFEAQLVPATTRTGPALEIGFHSEHPDRARNDEVLARLVAEEKAWREMLGPEPEAGRFLGRQAATWRRISELWDQADLDEVDGVAEVADRLDAYIRALEPIRAQAAARGQLPPTGRSRSAGR